MSNRNKGFFGFDQNFEVSANAPLDARMLVPDLAALADVNNFPSAYIGMIVGVANTSGNAADPKPKIFQCKALNNDGVPAIGNGEDGWKDAWKEVGVEDVTSQNIAYVKTVVDALCAVNSAGTAISGRNNFVLIKQLTSSYVNDSNIWQNDGENLKIKDVVARIDKTNGLDLTNKESIVIPHATPAAATTWNDSQGANNGRAGVMSGIDKKKLDDLHADKPVAISDAELDALCAQAELSESGVQKITWTVSNNNQIIDDTANNGRYYMVYTNITAKAGTSPGRAPIVGDEIEDLSNPAKTYIIYEIFEPDQAAVQAFLQLLS